MKKAAFFLFFLMCIFLLALVECKKEPVAGSHSESDTAYIATPYQLPQLNAARYRAINVPADNPMTQEGVQLGRMLFYDPVISADSTVSCASCHKSQFSFADSTRLNARALGGITTRNAMALVDMGMNKAYFWDIRKTTLEAAVSDAMNGEQWHSTYFTKARIDSNQTYLRLFHKAFGRGDITDDKMVKAIAQFIRTLISYNTKFDRYMLGDQSALNADEYAGYQLFMDNDGGDCFHCHIDLTYLTMTNQIVLVANNALDSAATLYDFPDIGYGGTTANPNDNGRFKIPTLRNIALTAPYMHDGRYATLEEVIGHYSDSLHYSPNVDPLMQFIAQRGTHLTPVQKQQLLAFLNALTDTTFTNNPAFQNPF